MSKPTLLLTTTGEPYQPVRLKWTVPGKAYCLPRLRALRCIGLDAETKALSLWLSAEAEHLKLGDALGFPQPMHTPLAGRQVILGIFRFPDSASMVLEVRSIPRAIALARLLRPVLGEKAKLTRVRVINRWFEARESADDLLNLDKCLDRNVTVIRWEDTADELDAVVAKGKTPEERRALWEAWHNGRRHVDVPLVEDFPCHPEEENEQMGDLANTLNFRFVRAGRVWGGERVTLQQVIEETVAKVPPLPVPGSTANEIGDGTPRRRNSDFTATEVSEGKAQLEFFEDGDQWVPRGHVVRCQILSDAAIEPELEEKFVSIDGRDFTLAEFRKMVGSFGGWGMRIEFVPEDELQRPKLKVGEPDAREGS